MHACLSESISQHFKNRINGITVEFLNLEIILQLYLLNLNSGFLTINFQSDSNPSFYFLGGENSRIIWKNENFQSCFWNLFGALLMDFEGFLDIFEIKNWMISDFQFLRNLLKQRNNKLQVYNFSVTNFDKDGLKSILQFLKIQKIKSDQKIDFANFMQSAEKSRKILENPLIMKNVLEDLDFFEIECLRKVSQNVRSCIEIVKPDPKIRKISLKFQDSNFIPMDICSKFLKNLSIFYQKTWDGYSVNRTSFDGPCDLSKIFLSDFEQILKNQRVPIELLDIQGSNEQFMDIVLGNCSSKFFGRVQVQNLSLQRLTDCQVFQILQFIDSKFLETITIMDAVKSFNLDDFSKLDQWKMAKLLTIEGFSISTPIQNLDIFNFSKMDIKVSDISMEDIIHLKAKFLESATVIKLKINFERFTNSENIQNFLGRPYSQKPHNSIWFIRIPDSQKCLHLNYVISRFFIFTRFNASCIPEDAFPDQLEYQI
ncbi:hypothetical protein L5515_010362 [Caenorhabditis briggsae]|uniref:DUF38 domain-containing protein n=1 Tax=Caenorhabditis briggsae TaxID=6238 RepID=A0AAE9ERM6_CAEBR|nr:hypothetical protein L5515_010362 [Caenorhabditis briggsae]